MNDDTGLLGVEEAFFARRPGHPAGRVADRSSRRGCRSSPDEEVALELFRHQVESSTPPLRDGGELEPGAAATADGRSGKPPLPTVPGPLRRPRRRFSPDDEALYEDTCATSGSRGRSGRSPVRPTCAAMHVQFENAYHAEGVLVIDGISSLEAVADRVQREPAVLAGHGHRLRQLAQPGASAPRLVLRPRSLRGAVPSARSTPRTYQTDGGLDPHRSPGRAGLRRATQSEGSLASTAASRRTPRSGSSRSATRVPTTCSAARSTTAVR